MNHCADGFGRGGIEQVGADSRGRVDAEQEYEDGGHERPAANSGQPNQEADHQAGEGMKEQRF